MNKREYLTTQELIERINLYTYRMENSQTEESFNINMHILSSLQQEHNLHMDIMKYMLHKKKNKGNMWRIKSKIKENTMDKKTINDVANRLQEMKKETINEDTKDAFYSLSDSIYGLDNLPQDTQTKKIQKDLKKLLDQLENHLNKKYKGWD